MHVHSSEQSSPVSKAFKAFTTGSSYWSLCQMCSMKAASLPSNVTASITLNLNTSGVSRVQSALSSTPSDDLLALTGHQAYPSAFLACGSGQSQTWRGTGTIVPGDSSACGPLGNRCHDLQRSRACRTYFPWPWTRRIGPRSILAEQHTMPDEATKVGMWNTDAHICVPSLFSSQHVYIYPTSTGNFPSLEIN